MTYFSAFLLATTMFMLVVLWSVIEFFLQNRKEKLLDSEKA